MIPFQGNDGIGRGRPTTMGVVLAAGAGRRYGGPKIVAEQGNWLDLALGALRDGGCDFVGLCMGARFVDPPPGVLGITVDDWDEGLGASVRAALREARKRFSGLRSRCRTFFACAAPTPAPT